MSMRIHRDQLAFSFEEPVALPYTLTCADVLDWAQRYTGPKFHAMLCDPPYHLTEHGGFTRRSSDTGSQFANPRTEDDKARRRAARTGFMGKDWDGGEIAFKPETWKALAQHLLPGAFVMAFGSSRGWHRLACAMEDAGLRIMPSIFGWLTGQSFPKATRIDSQIDAAAGAERKIIGIRKHPTLKDTSRIQRQTASQYHAGNPIADEWPITAPATPLAQTWAGHRYGGQVLKNSLEPIIVAQVPYAGKPVQSITQTGAGALNIDGGRIGAAPDDVNVRVHLAENHGQSVFGGIGSNQDRRLPRAHSTPPKRWPPNFALSHTPACVQVGTRQVRTKFSHSMNHPGDPGPFTDGPIYGQGPGSHGESSRDYTDANGMEEVAAWECADQCPVAALDVQAGERNPPWGTGQSLSQTPSWKQSNAERPIDNGQYQDGSNASRFFMVSDFSLDVAEQLAQAAPVHYAPKASRSERDAGLNGARNVHPTVKNLKLAQWHATLLLPPAAYAPRRLLVPFCGTGSEMIGALLSGWDEVVGIEQDAAYVEIAKLRLGYWQGRTTRP